MAEGSSRPDRVLPADSAIHIVRGACKPVCSVGAKLAPLKCGHPLCCRGMNGLSLCAQHTIMCACLQQHLLDVVEVPPVACMRLAMAPASLHSLRELGPCSV